MLIGLMSCKPLAKNFIYGCSAMILLIVVCALLTLIISKPNLSITKKYNIDINKLSTNHYKIIIKDKL